MAKNAMTKHLQQPTRTRLLRHRWGRSVDEVFVCVRLYVTRPVPSVYADQENASLCRQQARHGTGPPLAYYFGATQYPRGLAS
jgi:hypothetical protein